MANGPRDALTTVRGVLARFIAAVVDRFPSLEGAFIRAGCAVQRYYPLASLYYHAHTELCARLRASGRRYRRLNIQGVDVDVDVTDHTARLLYFHSLPYEREVTERLIAALAPGDVFVDVGANTGFYTTIAAVRVGPSGRVVAFEPHPSAREAMQAQLTRNGIADRVDVVAAAVGRSVASAVALHLTSDSVLSTLVPDLAPLRADYAFTRSIDVPMTTLDASIGGRPGLAGRIAAVKVDVEGFESDVIAGMAATIAAAPVAIVICETHADSDADRQLRAAGFTGESLDADARGFGNYLYRRQR